MKARKCDICGTFCTDSGNRCFDGVAFFSYFSIIKDDGRTLGMYPYETVDPSKIGCWDACPDCQKSIRDCIHKLGLKKERG